MKKIIKRLTELRVALEEMLPKIRGNKIRRSAELPPNAFESLAEREHIKILRILAPQQAVEFNRFKMNEQRMLDLASKMEALKEAEQMEFVRSVEMHIEFIMIITHWMEEYLLLLEKREQQLMIANRFMSAFNSIRTKNWFATFMQPDCNCQELQNWGQALVERFHRHFIHNPMIVDHLAMLDFPIDFFVRALNDVDLNENWQAFFEDPRFMQIVRHFERYHSRLRNTVIELRNNAGMPPPPM